MRMSILKALQILAIVLMCFCFFTWGYYSHSDHECVNEQYKAAYLNYIEKIDSNAIYIKEK